MADITVETLNSIRLNADSDYQDRIPEATRDNLALVATAITTYEPALNTVLSALVNKIGLTLIQDKLFKNPLGIFKKGLLENGSDIEQIFVDMTSSIAYDKTGANPFAITNADVKTYYHRQNRAETYPITVYQNMLKYAFTSNAGMQRLLASIINAPYKGASSDEFKLMKQLLATYSAEYKGYNVPEMVNEESAITFMKTVQKASRDMSFLTNQFNSAGVYTLTEPQDQVLLLHKDIVATVDVDVLSKSYNMGKSDFPIKPIIVDDFGDMTDTYALLVDKDFLMIYDTLFEMAAPMWNGKGMFWNYFLQVQQLYSVSRVHNAVRFNIITTPEG